MNIEALRLRYDKDVKVQQKYTPKFGASARLPGKSLAVAIYVRYLQGLKRIATFALPTAKWQEFGDRKLGSLRRDGLQDYLDKMAAGGFAYGTVGHLRWDLRQNPGNGAGRRIHSQEPTGLLFVPRG